jgi:hypothetical protein
LPENPREPRSLRRSPRYPLRSSRRSRYPPPRSSRRKSRGPFAPPLLAPLPVSAAALIPPEIARSIRPPLLAPLPVPATPLIPSEVARSIRPPLLAPLPVPATPLIPSEVARSIRPPLLAPLPVPATLLIPSEVARSIRPPLLAPLPVPATPLIPPEVTRSIRPPLLAPLPVPATPLIPPEVTRSIRPPLLAPLPVPATPLIPPEVARSIRPPLLPPLPVPAAPLIPSEVTRSIRPPLLPPLPVLRRPAHRAAPGTRRPARPADRHVHRLNCACRAAHGHTILPGMANIARRTFITADSLVIPWTMPFINDRRRRLIWFNRLIKIRESRVRHLIAFLQQSRRWSNASQPAPARDLRLTLFTPTRLFRFGDRRVSFGVFSQHINLFISKKTPCTTRKVAQRQRTFAHTDQPPHLIPQNARHFTDLALAPSCRMTRTQAPSGVRSISSTHAGAVFTPSSSTPVRQARSAAGEGASFKSTRYSFSTW